MGTSIRTPSVLGEHTKDEGKKNVWREHVFHTKILVSKWYKGVEGPSYKARDEKEVRTKLRRVVNAFRYINI